MKSLDGVWTQFWDMHSGGVVNVPPFDKIYVQASEEEAEELFEDVTGENPNWVNCHCCGSNYSVTESESLARATAYQRGCAYRDGQYVEEHNGNSWERYQTLEEYIKKDTVLLIFSDGSTDKLIGE